MMPIAWIAALMVAAPPTASIDVHKTVDALAFAPERFFDHGPGDDLVRIRYRGDDRGWPVYSITIRDRCLMGAARSGCRSMLVARMVRAPMPDGSERPRARGRALIGALVAAKPKTATELAARLDRAGLDWVEADLTSCPAAAEAFASGGEVPWVRPGLFRPTSDGELEIVMHADTIEVTFPDYLRQASYNGYIAEGTPAAWADALADALEPCWKPATAPPPWRKPPAALITS